MRKNRSNFPIITHVISVTPHRIQVFLFQIPMSSHNQLMEARLRRQSRIELSKNKADWNYLNANKCRKTLEQYDTPAHRRACAIIENRRKEVKIYEKLWIEACFRLLHVRLVDRPKSFAVSVRRVTWPHLKPLFLKCLRSYRPRCRCDIPSVVADNILSFL
jgi:hypothetical protein